MPQSGLDIQRAGLDNNEMQRTNVKLLLCVAALLAFFGGAFIPFLVQWVSESGRSLVNVQGAEEYLIALMWALGLAFIIGTFNYPWAIKRHLMWLWALRCFVTLFVMLFYESTYNLDAYEYYRNILRQQYLPQANWGGGTNFIISIGIFLSTYLPFGKSYHAFKVVWSFFGFLSTLPLYGIYKNLVKGKDSVAVLWALGAFPSLLFWTSILGKDPLALLGISVAAYGLLRLHYRISLENLALTIGGLVLISWIRFWLTAIFLAPALISFMWSKNTHKAWRWIAVGISGYAVGYFVLNIKEVLALTSAADALESLNYFSSSWARGGSGLVAPSFNSTSDVLAFLPLGMFTAIFRPLPGEVNNAFGIIAGIEGLGILFIFIYSLRQMKVRMWKNPVVTYCWVVIFMWSSFYAFLSYQNLGTAVRFRAQILPFLLLLPFALRALKEERAKRKKPKLEVVGPEEDEF